MNKTAKIVAITGSKPRSGGLNIYVEMDNGDKGQLNKKAITDVNIGDEITYTLESKDYNGNTYYTLKEPKKEWTGKKPASSSSDERVKFIWFALSYAKDLAVAGKLEMFEKSTGKEQDLMVCASADLLYGWMCKQYDELKNPTHTQTTQATKPTRPDDIPF